MMSDKERQLNFNRQLRREQQFEDESCLLCHESNPVVLERHHVAGRVIDSDFEQVLCANDHRKETAGQLDFGVNLSHNRDRDPLDLLQSWIRSVASFLTALVDSLFKLDEWITMIRGFLDERMPAWQTDMIAYMESA